MNVITLKFAFSLLPIFWVSTCLAQEVIFETDFSTKRSNDNSYCFGGYGLEGESEVIDASDSMSCKLGELADGGNDGACLTSTLDATKSTIPDFPAFDYVGWAGGSTFELNEAFKDEDLSQYSISFDAKISGTETLYSSKCFLQLVVADDAVAKDEDKNDDIVLRIIRGETDGTDTFALTDEYQTFSFNLKNDMRVTTGTVEDLAKYDVKKIQLMVQAQGDAGDIEKDADNVLYLDNVKLIKAKSKTDADAKPEVKLEAEAKPGSKSQPESESK